jgi:predicted transcriptional regulator
VNASEKETAKAKSAIQILRERRGGVPKALVERNRERTAVRRKLIQALQSGPKTVPELARDTGLPRHLVFWHLTAMRKYGTVREADECDQYFSYALVQEPSLTESSS